MGQHDPQKWMLSDGLNMFKLPKSPAFHHLSSETMDPLIFHQRSPPKDQLPREMSPGGCGQRMAGTDEVPRHSPDMDRNQLDRTAGDLRETHHDNWHVF